MKKTLEAEVIVLDRVMYVLEEESVGYLMQQDIKFAAFIEKLHDSLDKRVETLKTKVLI